MDQRLPDPAGAAPPDWRGLCSRMADELDHYRQLLADDRREVHPLAVEARAALAQPEPEVVGPTDEELLELYPATMVDQEDAFAFARAVLARWGRPTPAPAGEVVELAAWLRSTRAARLTRAADLLERQAVTEESSATAPVPVGMIPVEYWDMDSGARIVSEPSEERPGGCWLVLNSRHVSPFIEFSTAKAAWNALRAAHALPLPSGEVDHG